MRTQGACSQQPFPTPYWPLLLPGVSGLAIGPMEPDSTAPGALCPASQPHKVKVGVSPQCRGRTMAAHKSHILAASTRKGWGKATQLQGFIKGLLYAQYLCCTCDPSLFIPSYTMYFLSTYYVQGTITDLRDGQKGMEETHSLLSTCGRRQILNKESHHQMCEYKSC